MLLEKNMRRSRHCASSAQTGRDENHIVLTRQYGQRCFLNEPCQALDTAAALLYGRELRILCQRLQGLQLHADASAIGNVVEHDGQMRSSGNSLVMQTYALL